ncbi:hypothetical protein [Priestia megaterium]|jgi:hypothetical protein|uniref:hypothetical protein n=1 Tax=Priestia megaterium TaxID=1404 RepID=UPI0023633F2F|nr:hypothetical protein [Priestia megaterium]MDD1514755.1 hypothetical protein [Priestia megaterium]MDH3143227.1 hypothetical protein [Priestia megaterium]MED4237821.1 hypothetical protein [Priestia megaterium]MED4254488.1 hypothetical protein [Priestia megaterium]MED4263880.1 hypothetical protein [Priestia megaterium]
MKVKRNGEGHVFFIILGGLFILIGTLFANTSVYFLISGWIAAVCCLGISAVLKKGKTRSVSKEEEE